MTARQISKRNSLVEEALPAIRNVAHMVVRRFHANVEVDDLIQCGALGAMQAAEKYDPARGIPFPAFAYQRIRGAMYDSLRRGRFIELSMFSLTVEEDEAAFHDHGSENAAATHETPELEPLTESHVVEQIDRKRRVGKVVRAIRTLNPRQRKVVEIHYAQDRTLREASEAIGVSAPRAAQIRAEAITLIRTELGKKTPKRAA